MWINAEQDPTGNRPAHRNAHPRRRGGVLVALCGCSLDDAFLELIAAAKNHNVDAMTLAATIVALAEDPSGYECDEAAVRAATIAWEPLVRRRIEASGRDSDAPASLLER